MSIVRKVKAVERLFDTLQNEINVFQAESKLSCVAGCGKCCNKADINASPLEFLPWAFKTFSTGQAIEALEHLKNNKDHLCILYQPLSLQSNYSGSCIDYQNRGLICRLFGFGARRDKLGLLKMVTCKIIKDGQYEKYLEAEDQINQDLNIPIFSSYYMKLARIDFKLGHTILPINEAMKVALEEVQHHYAYRPFPRKFKKMA